MANCSECNGTGTDAKKQEKYRQTIDFKMQGGTSACWNCHGNGLEPSYPNSRKED